jgi:RNA polymerase sigma factor (sigma-70 family)
LFQRFRRGDPEATARAVKQAALVVRMRGYAIPEDQRTDVVQEVMVEMWRRTHRKNFAAGGAFDTYVRTLAYWRCIDWIRKRKRQAPLDSEIPGRSAGPDDLLLAKERRELGRRVLRKLREACRELIRLHTKRGLTYREIGKLLGRSEGALRVQMSECLKEARRIRAQLTGHGEVSPLREGGSP